jgi:hypothetical protein
MTTKICWAEAKCAAMIEKIKRSGYAKLHFEYARMLMKEGYASDVALQKSWNMWN